MKKTLLYIVAAALFLVTLYITEVQVGWHQITSEIAQLPLLPLLGLICLSMINYMLRVVRILTSFELSSKQSSTAFYITTHHNLLNILLPMRLGEVSFPLLIKRHFQVGYVESSTHLLVYRLFDLMVLFSIFTIMFAFSVSLFAFFVTLFIVITSIFCITPLCIRLARLAQKLPGALTSQISESLTRLSKTDRKLRYIFFITWMVWLFKLLAFVLFCRLISELSYFDALLSIVVADLSSVLPIHGFAGTGTFEGAFVLGGLVVGATSQQLLAVAVQLHIYLIFNALLAATIGFLLHMSSPSIQSEPAK